MTVYFDCLTGWFTRDDHFMILKNFKKTWVFDDFVFNFDGFSKFVQDTSFDIPGIPGGASIVDRSLFQSKWPLCVSY